METKTVVVRWSVSVCRSGPWTAKQVGSSVLALICGYSTHSIEVTKRARTILRLIVSLLFLLVFVVYSFVCLFVSSLTMTVLPNGPAYEVMLQGLTREATKDDRSVHSFLMEV